jgi:hypothetical protein
VANQITDNEKIILSGISPKYSSDNIDTGNFIIKEFQDDLAMNVVTRIPSERIGTHVQDMCVKTNAHTRMWSRVEIEKCFRFLVTL